MRTKGRATVRLTKPQLLDQEDDCPECARAAGFVEELGTLLAAIAKSNEQRVGRGLVEAHICAKCRDHVVPNSVRYRPMSDFAGRDWTDVYEQIQAYDQTREVLIVFVDPEQHFTVRRLSKPQSIA